MILDLNGKWDPEDQPVFSAGNRGFNYADGLFETLKFSEKSIFFLEDHIKRLFSGMKMLKMEIPEKWSTSFFENRIKQLINQNNIDDSQPLRIKINVFRNSTGLFYPVQNQVFYVIRISPLQKALYVINSNPYKVDVYHDNYICSSVLSNLKTTERIINILGSMHASEEGLDNCFLMNEKGNISEALNGNIFLLQSDTLKTPALNQGCINGILRKEILEISLKTKFRAIETQITQEDLVLADEIWITNVIMGIKAVSFYKNRVFENKIAGKFTDLLNRKVLC